jgi:acyl-CoA synthetase (AMP-forming)/AMP-acid ligase II
VIDALRSAVGATTGTARAICALTRSGVVRPVRPDRALGMATGLLRYRLGLAAGYAAGAARHPGRAAVVDDAGALSYAELDWRTDRLARAFAARGLGPGHPVALLCRNSRHPIEVAVAAEKIGADVALLNTGLSPTQLLAVVTELGVHTVVTDVEFTERLHELPPTIGVVTAWGGDPGDPTSCEQLVAAGSADVAALPLRPPSTRTIVLTSGTTGTPKGARRPHPSSLAPAASILSEIPLRAGESVLVAAPLFHTWGNAALLLAVLHGSTVVLRRRFDPAGLLDAVAGQRCGVVFAVPVMLARLLDSDAPGWRGGHRPRVVAVSGSALPGALATRFMDRFGDVLYNLYGSTEVSWVSIAGPADLRAAPGTAGRAPTGTTLVVLDDDGRPVPPGTVGRVFVGNDLPFEGYTGAGPQIETHDGLLGTGDLGSLDDRGRLHLTGRADDMIVSGGENVHPGPVEDLLTAHPEVREAAVVGVPDDEFGQRLAAYVVRTPDSRLDADAVRDLVRGKLARFAVPRDVVFLDELPRNQTGKVLTRDLPPPR